MNHRMIQPAMALAVAAALLAGGAPAQAQALEVLNPPIQAKADNKAHKKPAKTRTAGQGNKAKFMPGSQETRKERAARLQRECKGAVNAGACEGYTR